MLSALFLSLLLSVYVQGHGEQVHVSGSTGPTVVGSAYPYYPAYAPYPYPYYPYAPYSYYPARYGYSDAYAPAAATHGYGNVNHATGTPYIYSRQPADIPYGQQEARQEYSSYAPAYVSPYYRYHYSYVPVAATHGYGNVNYATGTPYIYSSQPADIPYGQQEPRQEYSSYAPTYAPTHVSPYYRYHYSYVPAAATHGYGNVNYATGTPYIYSRQPADIPYGQQDPRQEYSSYAPTY